MIPTHLKRATAGALTCFGLLTNASALSGVSSWASAEVTAAQIAGLEPTSLSGLSATQPITRAEFCKIALQAYNSMTGFYLKQASASPFEDCDDLDIATAYQYGLISGRSDTKFDPNAPIARQDLAVIFANLLDATGTDAPEITGFGCVEDYADFASVSDYATDAVVTMVDYAVIGGMQANAKTVLAPKSTATREQALIMVNRFCETFAQSATIDAPKIINVIGKVGTDVNTNDPEAQQTEKKKPTASSTVDTTYFPQDTQEKMDMVYGVGGAKYETAEEAEPNMVEITVNVWRLQADGTKTSGKAYLKVNKNLAHVYEAVFEEIYNGDEKFPIKDAGCYAWRTGEHSQGTAIDLNWDENMEATINADGTLTPTTGTLWEPGTNPYSFPAEGDVVTAFKKYGFTWGGDAWSSKRDYMHFSYFGR